MFLPATGASIYTGEDTADLPPTILADRRADWRALAIRSDCAGPFGAVRELDRPSWLTATPRTKTVLAPEAAGWQGVLASRLLRERTIREQAASART